MELTSNDLSSIVRQYTTCREGRGYIILLGGSQFVSSRRKKVFAKKSHAMLSLRSTIEYSIKNLVRQHLIDSGVDVNDIYKSEDYDNAWENFINQATESGFLQMIELNNGN